MILEIQRHISVLANNIYYLFHKKFNSFLILGNKICYLLHKTFKSFLVLSLFYIICF